MLDNLCGPALLNVGFSLAQVVIDVVKQSYNTALLKFVIMIIFTIILNLLCQMGLEVISWFVVFLPFIFMTVVTTILLYVFGLNGSFGKFDYTIDYPNNSKYNNNYNNRDNRDNNNNNNNNNSNVENML